jgi:endo-1,4-beta-xylanase
MIIRLLIVMTLPILTAPLFAQPPDVPPVQPPARQISWVNPKLPEGPGLTHHVLASTALGHDVGYVVWTPPGYDTTKKYPVVYFLHGAGGTESADAAGFSSWVAKGIEKCFIPPVIVVFPNGGMSGYRGEVEKMIVEELIPLIDKSHPTIGTAESRVVAGFSMGGQGGVRLAVFYPELFAAAASMGGGADETTAATAEKNAAVLKQRHVGFLMINGEKDRPAAFEGLAKRLEAGGVENEIIVHSDLGHDLGRYYELSNDRLMKFLGAHLKSK